MNKSGFTLIELLIATAIAAMLAVLLFASLYQINRYIPVIDTTTDVYEKAALLNAQLERDLSGVTVPNEYYVRQGGQQEGQPEQKKKDEAGKKETEDQKKKKENEQEVKPKKPLEKIFYSVNKEGVLDQLTFITTNPLQVYWSTKTGSAKPRITRVVYTLRPDSAKQAAKSYSLIRQESDNLEYNESQIKEGKGFVIAEGIRSLTPEYTAIIEQKENEPQAQEKEKKAAAEQKKKREIKKMSEWLAKSQKEAAQAEQKEKLPLVPHFAGFTIAFWDTQKKRSISFPFKIKILSEAEEKRTESAPIVQKLKQLIGHAFPNTPPNTTMAQSPPSNNIKVSIRR